MNKFVKQQWLIDGIDELGIRRYTNIQNYTIPKILKGENVIGISPTGTGKTYCFLFPILDNLDLNYDGPQVIIILPTRELARQIFSKVNFFKKFGSFKSKLIIGGKIDDSYIREQIVVSTPQKFLEATQNKKIDLGKIKTIIFDEADMLIDLGFKSLFKNIIESIPNHEKVQKLAFSATLHEMLSNQLSAYFKKTHIYDVSESIWTNQNKIKHFLIHFDQEDKMTVLKKLVDDLKPYFCIIFANKKSEVEEINLALKEMNKDVLMLHGDLEARARKNAYKNIGQNNAAFLVSTDLSSRGIDIEGVSHIISYNLPLEDLWFMHRVGRTGRNNMSGITYTFMTKEDEIKISRLKSKGIDWFNLKSTKNGFDKYDYEFRRKPLKKETEVDRQIRQVIVMASKQVKPGYKKKTKLAILDIKRKAKRSAIDKAVKKTLVKKYKIENAKRTKIKLERAEQNNDF